MTRRHYLKWERDLMKHLHPIGFEVDITKASHLKITHKESGRFIYASRTPSDTFALKNIMGDVKEFVRWIA